MRPFSPSLLARILEKRRSIVVTLVLLFGFIASFSASVAHAQTAPTTVPAAASPPADLTQPAAPVAHAGGEADLHLPDLNNATFFNGSIGGRTLLSYGLILC